MHYMVVFPLTSNGYEERVDRFLESGAPPPEGVTMHGRWFTLGHDLGFIDVDELWADLASVSPLHAGLTFADVAATDTEGVLLTGSSVPRPATAPVEIPESSDLRLVVTRKMYDDGTILTNCPSLKSNWGRSL